MYTFETMDEFNAFIIRIMITGFSGDAIATCGCTCGEKVEDFSGEGVHFKNDHSRSGTFVFCGCGKKVQIDAC